MGVLVAGSLGQFIDFIASAGWDVSRNVKSRPAKARMNLIDVLMIFSSIRGINSP
jgi:hypothetical protein